MSTRTPTGKAPRSPIAKDRRAPAGKKDALRLLKGALGRPIALERRDGSLRVVLVERRRPASAGDVPSVAQLCEELSARLLAHGPDYAARSMRDLVRVHDALDRRGWAGVAALPGQVLVDALAQAEMLASDEPSASLAIIIEGLRPLQSAAELRDERDSRLQDLRVGENLEVSESSHAEFDDFQRSWLGTVPTK
jgi:hypothetical protein